jgi:hypothetical protein
LEDAREAFRQFAAGDIFGKVVITV